MPLDQVISELVRSNCLSVVLVKSLDLFKPGTITSDKENEEVIKNIDISPSSIFWIEKNTQHRILVGEYFDFENVHEARGLIDCIFLNLKLCETNFECLMSRTVRVEIKGLRINLVANKPFSLHCSNCAKELSQMRAYRLVAPLPGIAMRVPRDFWDNFEMTKIAHFDQIYYGLNQIVMSANHIKFDTEMIYCPSRRRVLCPGCSRVLGTFLSNAVCLHADALRMGTRVSPAAPLDFNELLGHITPTQLMLRLLKNVDKSRLFLKTVRPDGQIHYLLMMTESKKLTFLRSKLSLSSKLDPKPVNFPDADTSSEWENSMESSSDGIENDDSMNSSSSISIDKDSPNTVDLSSFTPRPPRKMFGKHDGRETERTASTPNKPINYVYLTPYNGCRVQYIFASNDSELRDIQNTVDNWRDNNMRSLRISYSMMIDLVSELNANEHIEAALQNSKPPFRSQPHRCSHIIFETDEEFYATQQQLDEVRVQPTPDENSEINEIIDSDSK
ncbi:uncharacterized protein [Drosophila pseudoobscura]|uniref:Ubiquitin-conjugating enzyme E2C-binding protein n=1 Tax=Drosophila pseudoobscura pseudoobscura TaxID=46245 RepID=A0A6I8V396_DROPS|nr:uncharacterized protein LOC6897669 [Drosophila pseudoobscura]